MKLENYKDIFTKTPFTTDAYSPTLTETISQQSFPGGFKMPTSSTQSEVKLSSFPVTPVNNTAITGANAQNAQKIKSIQDEIAKLQGVMTNAKSQGATDKTQIDAQGNVIPQETQTQEVSTFGKMAGTDKLLEMIQGLQSQIANKGSVESQIGASVDSALAKYGLTQDSFNKITELRASQDAIDQQLAKLDAQEQQALMNVSSNREYSLEYSTAEQNRIKRQSAINKSSLIAESALYGKRISDLTGDRDNAMKLAEVYISNMVYPEKQRVDDLTALTNTYSGLLQAMDESDRAWVSNALTEARDEWNKKKDIAQLELDTYEAETSRMNANRLLAESGAGNSIISQTPLSAVFNRAMSGTVFNTPDREFAQKEISGLIQSGNIESAKQSIKDYAVAGIGGKVYQDYVNRNNSISYLQEVKNELQTYIDNSGDTGLIKGGIQAAWNKIKKTTDPDLLSIKNKIDYAVTQFTVASSGVQFSDKEREIYKQMFPSWFGSKSYNFAKLDSMISSMQTANESIVKAKLGALYEDVKPSTTQGASTQETSVNTGAIIEYKGKRYKVGANGELTQQ